jgi:aminoglycoside 2'-N-acetyltransferase I
LLTIAPPETCAPADGPADGRIAESRVPVVDVAVLESSHADAATRKALRRLWDRAFGDRFDDIAANHAYGGVHVLVRDGGHLIGHASAVPRLIRFGDQPWRTVGYVEAVATDPERQGEGVGRLAMERLHEEIASRWVAALLSTGRATGFYELFGWQRWLGPTYTQTRAGVVLDGHEGLMVFSCDRSVALDRTVAVTCQDRPGDVW